MQRISSSIWRAIRLILKACSRFVSKRRTMLMKDSKLWNVHSNEKQTTSPSWRSNFHKRETSTSMPQEKSIHTSRISKTSWWRPLVSSRTCRQRIHNWRPILFDFQREQVDLLRHQGLTDQAKWLISEHRIPSILCTGTRFSSPLVYSQWPSYQQHWKQPPKRRR
mgnify:CR=1 FL=1